MTQVECCDSSKVSLLQELFSAATHDASTAMCRWTNSLIHLTLDEVREMPLEDACGELDLGDELLTMIVLNLDGEIGGSMVLMFDEGNGRQLAASLLHAQPNDGPDWNELEQSALMETGNILGCAYVNAITRLIDRTLLPSVPDFIRDYGASVVEQALAAQAASRDTVLVCRTCFQHENEKLNWWLLFVPSIELRMAMENALCKPELSHN
jgi:chemotaxis protein CheC